MRESHSRPPNNMLLARRALEDIGFTEILEDLVWDEIRSKWVLHVALTPKDIAPDGIIQKTTNWYVLVDHIYPAGTIKFYPSKLNGIKETFPHQNFNDETARDCPWRTGDLCLNTPTHRIGNFVSDPEPSEPDRRLLWHFQRAGEWLIAASKNELLKPGDDFEIPQFPNASSKEIFLYSESPHSFRAWEVTSTRRGLAEIHRVDSILSVTSFTNFKREPISTKHFGSYLSSGSTIEFALWILLDSVPVTHPWRAPRTWGDLTSILETQERDLIEILRMNLRHFRDGHSHLMLLGFPTPKIVAEKNVLIQWQALKLPLVSHGRNFAAGFRNNEQGYFRRDIQFFTGNKTIEWIQSKNIDESQLSTRGKLDAAVAGNRFALIGTGAVGSILSEVLVRSGVKEIVLIDGDDLEVGNLTRHTLSLKELGKNKADSLAGRLNLVSAHARITSVPRNFGNPKDASDRSIKQADIILDCTGQDDTLTAFEAYDWGQPKFFFSISVGFEAKRLFCFHSYGSKFPKNTFVEFVQPWIAKERGLYSESGLPREGVGCWNLVFPGRIEDIILMVAPCIKIIERVITNNEMEPRLEVFEQVHSKETGFQGIRQAS